MPAASERQERFMWALVGSPALRREHDITKRQALTVLGKHADPRKKKRKT